LLKGELEQVSSQAGRLSCDLANQQRQIIQETRTTSINASLILFLLTHRKVTGMNKHDTASNVQGQCAIFIPRKHGYDQWCIAKNGGGYTQKMWRRA